MQHARADMLSRLMRVRQRVKRWGLNFGASLTDARGKPVQRVRKWLRS